MSLEITYKFPDDAVKTGREDEELDAALYELLSKDNEATQIVSVDRYAQMNFSKRVLEKIAIGDRVSVVEHKNEWFKDTGSIRVEGKSVSFSDPVWFSRVCEFASAVDIYPLINGSIRIEFTFSGLTTKI